MDFKALSNYLPISALDVVELNGLQTGYYDVMLFVNDNMIFSDSYFCSDNQLKVYNVGDILELFAGSSVAVSCRMSYSLQEVDSADLSLSARDTRSFTVVPTRAGCVDDDFSILTEHFLNAAPLSLVPSGARMALAAVGDDTADIPPVMTLSDGSTVNPSKSGAGAVYSFCAPVAKGTYLAQAGERKQYILVTDIPQAHCISCRNVLNAPDYIYISAEIKSIRSRSAQTAVSGGSKLEYDIRPTSSFEVSAKYMTESIMRHLEVLPFASDIHIDGISVCISDLKIEHSQESRSLYECKFTADIGSNNALLMHRPERIFRNPFNRSFN